MAPPASSSSSKRKPQPPLVKHYLALYNMVQFFGWGYGLFLTIQFLATSGKATNFRLLWEHCSLVITVFQTYQLIEVVHALVRFVPSSPFQTLTQILSRIVLVWGILIPIPDSRHSFGVPMLLVAWCIAECTRYFYYGFNIYNAAPYLSTWLRYTLFIVLYPLGVSGELFTVYHSLPAIRRDKVFTFTLPNAFNISFYYDYAVIVFMLSYFHFFPQLYLFMLRQRRKVLGSGSGSAKGSTSSAAAPATTTKTD